ncbi:DUF5655 domain-containing protein [Occultella kanbiaonis]|uniref:DUF5655 domain-containing protein n=1 Tax=Occultella kanbiaonis TaxID=2675754 RepID=UPI0012B7D477|nr:DUF5655 domain-containing protein [Occultella kanbiaonis]
MASLDDAVATQIANIEANSGRTIAQWTAAITAAGLTKHGEMIAWLKAEHGFTHGNANLVATLARQGDAPPSDDELLAAQYAGAKAALRPIHDAILDAATALGDDVEVAVKKTGVSLRRRKQFALVEAPSAKRVVLGLNAADVAPTDRLEAATGMCNRRVLLTDVEQVDSQVRSWLRAAYESA